MALIVIYSLLLEERQLDLVMTHTVSSLILKDLEYSSADFFIVLPKYFQEARRIMWEGIRECLA